MPLRIKMNRLYYMYAIVSNASIQHLYLFLKNTIHVCSMLLFTEAFHYGQAFELFRAQSFTSLKADLHHQDIRGSFAFSRCLNGTFHIGILSQMRRVTNTNILL